MKTNETNIDELIKQALTEEESEMLERLGEQSVLEQMMSTFQGKMKWIAIYSIIIILVLFGLSVYCLFEFLNANNTRDMVMWGAGMGMGMMAVGMLKIWHWMQMDKNAILREIKRLQLQLATLNKNNV